MWPQDFAHGGVFKAESVECVRIVADGLPVGLYVGVAGVGLEPVGVQDAEAVGDDVAGCAHDGFPASGGGFLAVASLDVDFDRLGGDLAGVVLVDVGWQFDDFAVGRSEAIDLGAVRAGWLSVEWIGGRWVWHVCSFLVWFDGCSV